jgi:hypothetical protein
MPTKKCKLCIEKQVEIDRILSGYRKDKRAWAKDKKVYKIIIGVCFGLMLLITAFGNDGLKMALDAAKGIVN